MPTDTVSLSWVKQALLWPVLCSVAVVIWIAGTRDTSGITVRGVLALLTIALPIALVHGLALGLVSIVAGKVGARSAARLLVGSNRSARLAVFSSITGLAVAVSVWLYLTVIPASQDAPPVIVPTIAIGTIALLASSIYGRNAI